MKTTTVEIRFRTRMDTPCRVQDLEEAARDVAGVVSVETVFQHSSASGQLLARFEFNTLQDFKRIYRRIMAAMTKRSDISVCGCSYSLSDIVDKKQPGL